MKIQPPIRNLTPGTDSTSGADRTNAKPSATPAPKSGTDRVDLSDLSAQIAALESSLAADGGFDAQRVEAIKRAIVEGRLSVDAGTVADRMIASALSVIDRRVS